MMREFIGKHASHIGLVLVLLLAAYLRFDGLGRNSLWLDECSVANHALAGGLGDIIDRVAHDIHPPLLYFQAYLTIEIFGKSESALRLPSAILGIAACLFTYLLARSFVGRSSAILAAFLMAICPLAIYNSQQLRPYSHLSFMGALAAFAMIKLAQKRSVWRTTGIALLFAAMLYTHYVAIFFIISLVASFLVVYWRERGMRMAVVIASLGSLLLFSPWIPVLINQTDDKIGHLWPFGLSSIWDMFFSEGPFSGAASDGVISIGASILMAAVCAGVLRTLLKKGLKTNKARLAIVICPLVFFGVGFLMSLHRPFYRPKSGLIIYPLLMTLAAMGLEWLASLPKRAAIRHLTAATLFVVLVSFGLVSAHQSKAPRYIDGRGMALYIRDNIPSDPIIVDCNYVHGLEFYITLACPDYPSDRIMVVKDLSDFRLQMHRARRFSRFWLVSVLDEPSPVWEYSLDNFEVLKKVEYYKISAALLTWPEEQKRAISSRRRRAASGTE
ncbi:MAG: glycosyltransferase family 39 protein [Candidatus Coatesbacteria bacterium]|nr:glycosyltransferase family 39 protein [Candidatus Coatesbacteria bacterium]